MTGQLIQTILMTAICGFAVLMVFAMVVDGYIGGPARDFAAAVMQATTSDVEGGLRGPCVWLQQTL